MKKIKVSAKNKVTKQDEEKYALLGKLQSKSTNETDLKRQIKYWQKEAEMRERELGTFLEISKGTYEHNIKPKRSSRTSETIPIILASDWHCEESVNPDIVNGKNEFDLEIADRRITKFFQSSLRMIEIWRAGTKIDSCVLALLGDFFSGYIHEELKELNALSPTHAVKWVQERIAAGIDMLLKEGKFKEIIIPCCMGNHGRTIMKKPASTMYRNSYEWLMYNNLAMKYDKNKRVKFLISDGYHNIMKIFDTRVRFHHGDGMRYLGGVGGISIPVNKSITAWNASDPCDLDIFGHFHQLKDSGDWICNGSLIGYNGYALSIKARFETPKQALVMIEKKRGRTACLPILTD